MTQVPRIDINAGASNDAFRWAIAGYGHVAVAHTEGIMSAGHKLVGFSTTDPDIRGGDATKLEFNIGPTKGRLFDSSAMTVTETAEELTTSLIRPPKKLGEPSKILADGVIVAVPTKYHLNVAKMFGIAGFPCFIETPAAGTAKDARELADFFAAKKIPVVVGHVLPAFPEFSGLRAILLQKGIGNVTSLTMRRFVSWKETDDADANAQKGGAAADLLIHDVNLIAELGEAEEVVATSSTSRHGLIQEIDMTVKLREAVVPFRIIGGACGTQKFHDSYEVTFSDGTRVEFDGKTVTGMEVTPRSVGEIFAEELQIAAAYFRGQRPDASYLSMEGAINALVIMEAAIASAKRKK